MILLSKTLQYYWLLNVKIPVQIWMKTPFEIDRDIFISSLNQNISPSGKLKSYLNIKSARFLVKTFTRESFAIEEVILIINLSEDRRTWGTSLIPPQHSEVQVFQSTTSNFDSTQYCHRNHLNKYLHITSCLWVFATPFELSKSLNLLWLYKISDYFYVLY